MVGGYNVESGSLASSEVYEFVVTYAANGASGGSVPSAQIKTYGVNLTVASNSGFLVRVGYTFTGWNTAADGSGTAYAAGSSYSTDEAAVLYAQWAPGVTDTEAFVTRFYLHCLSRQPDSGGLVSWTAAVTGGSQSGGDVARGFVLSPEFKSRNLSNNDFVDTLYRAFFDREPDPDGKAAWMQALANGALREDVLYGFIMAQEFTDLCTAHGIVQISSTLQREYQVRQFVRRFYQQCLSREPDEGGIATWTQGLLNGSMFGRTLAQGFVLSQEFQNRNLSNHDVVTVLYRAFFNREPDAGGYAYWMAALAGGSSRTSVLDGFIGAQEFINLCDSYSILPFPPAG